jgi:Sec-independent protein secretion pathway component TatC
MSSTSLVAVVIVVPLVLVLAYLTVAPRTRSMERLRVAVLGAVLLAYVGVVAAALVELPVAVVCDMGRQNVEVKSTARRGYFEEHRLGPCVTYTQHSRSRAPTGTQTSYGD